jgi:hypothetical protein
MNGRCARPGVHSVEVVVEVVRHRCSTLAGRHPRERRLSGSIARPGAHARCFIRSKLSNSLETNGITSECTRHLACDASLKSKRLLAEYEATEAKGEFEKTRLARPVGTRRGPS